MEQAFFVSQVELLEDFNPSPYDRMYFGIEFCQHLIPSSRELGEAMDYAEQHNLKFTFVTPYVTDAFLEKFKELFKSIEKRKPDAEIVVNDWGILRMLNSNFSFPAYTLGRLMNKMKRDPRIAAFMDKMPPEIIANFRDTHLSIAAIRNFLKKFKINRLEFDNLLQGIAFNVEETAPEMHISIYYPFGYITTTRLCKISEIEKDGTFVVRCILKCPRTCRNYRAIFTNDVMKVPIAAQGNTFFFKNEKLPENLNDLGVDRLIFQPEIPMPIALERK
ncbi:MAG: hypothetical protein M1536_07245 [Firmicutes bacterium]|nr:hypothetical protein [Bacillota bacterium]